MARVTPAEMEVGASSYLRFMRDPATNWHPAAAYLYVLHLDGPALAWEYLRRNPNYRFDWHRRLLGRHRPYAEPAGRWGLRLLEDPERDGRDAQPDWMPDPDTLVLVHPDDDPPARALPFQLWRFPGRKHLTHDGKRLVLTCQWAGRVLRLGLSTKLKDGMAHAFAVRADREFHRRWRAIEAELSLLDGTTAPRPGIASGRPGRNSLLHMRALQALDGTLAGASQRQIAEVLFGGRTVAERWDEDCDLRAQVRRLIRRGRIFMASGYLRLLHDGYRKQGR
jgi:hypothetical protein